MTLWGCFLIIATNITTADVVNGKAETAPTIYDTTDLPPWRSCVETTPTTKINDSFGHILSTTPSAPRT